VTTPRERWLGLLLAALALAGLGISIYLTATKLSGTLPVCGPLGGCETVDASEWSTILGIPTAAFGIVYSAVAGLLGLAWWRVGDRRALLAAYALGLAGLLVEAFLAYLQLVVIGAVCVWCAAYGATVILGWLVVLVALRRAPA
jgi:uncharacterized membrane protein